MNTQSIVTITKCLCGHPSCDYHGLSDGSFNQGNGWSRELAQKHADAFNAYDDLMRQVEGLETLRPVWAEGWNDGSVSEQVCSAALGQIWKLLGVTNQTNCIEKLSVLVKAQP